MELQPEYTVFSFSYNSMLILSFISIYETYRPGFPIFSGYNNSTAVASTINSDSHSVPVPFRSTESGFSGIIVHNAKINDSINFLYK